MKQVIEKLVEIIRKALKKEKKRGDKRGTAIYTEETVAVEWKHTFVCALLKWKETGKGSLQKIEEKRKKAGCEEDYMFYTKAQLKYHIQELKKPGKNYWLINGKTGQVRPPVISRDFATSKVEAR